jgi:hypothetical protein
VHPRHLNSANSKAYAIVFLKRIAFSFPQHPSRVSLVLLIPLRFIAGYRFTRGYFSSAGSFFNRWRGYGLIANQSC